MTQKRRNAHVSRGRCNSSDFPDNGRRPFRVVLLLKVANFVNEVVHLDVKCVAETDVVGDPIYSCEIGR